MTTLPASKAAGLLLAACVTAALAGCGTVPAGQASQPAGTTASRCRGASAAAGSPCQRAVADAARILASFRPPPGARRSPVRPAGAPTGLARAPETPATPDLVDRSAWWQVRGNPRAALAWVSAHVPRGFSQVGSGSLGHAGRPSVWNVVFGLPDVRAVLTERRLMVSAAATSKGQTALRVDAQVVWLPAKPRAERIPSAATVVKVTPVPGLDARVRSGHAYAPVTITSRAAVARISAIIDRLPVSSGSYSCPSDTGKELRLTFRAGRHGRVLAVAVARLTGCRGVSLTVGGKSQPFLAGLGSLERQVLSITGARWPGFGSRKAR